MIPVIRPPFLTPSVFPFLPATIASMMATRPKMPPITPQEPQAPQTPQEPQTPQPPPASPGFQEPPKEVKEAQAKQATANKKKTGGLNPWVLASIVGVFVVIGVVAGLLLFGGDKSKPEVITPAAGTTPASNTVEGTEAQGTDNQTAVLTAKADSLVNVGNQHGEAFEDAYIDAYKNYKQAIALSPSDELTRKLGELETKLNKR